MPPPQICRWHVFPDATALEQAAVARVLAAEQAAIARAGVFRCVLAGGNTPRRVYAALASAVANWARWHVWFGDERCLPPGHTERNSRMALDAWLDRVAIPPAQLHVIPAEAGATEAARRYARELTSVGAFDLVLLGLGEDGHTASLFPGQDCGAGADAPDALAIFDAPKPPSERVSLSAHRLSATHEVIFLVSGSGKRQAVADWRAGRALPAAAITPANGVDILLDFA